MNEVINNLLDTAITTIVGSSMITNSSIVAGNALEAGSKHDMLQTSAKILQSTSAAFIGMWATFHFLDAMNCAWNSMLYSIVPITAGVIITIPALTHLLRAFSPENRNGIEKFEQYHWTALKVLNIMTAGISLAAGIYFGYALGAIAFSGVSLISSAYTMQQSSKQSV